MMELSMAAKYAGQEFARSRRLFKWVLGILIAGAVCYSVGPNFESNVFPVMRDQSWGRAFRTQDNRLCVPWKFVKTRNAVVELASARFYTGDVREPTLMGITLYNGHLLGAVDNLTAPVGQPWESVLCVKPRPADWNAYRLGVVFVINYRSVKMWTSTVQSPWIDWPNQDQLAVKQPG